MNLVICCFHSIPLKSDKYFDLTGAVSFILSILYSILVYFPFSYSTVLVSIFALIWSLRLGYYLFTRTLKLGLDNRFQPYRQNPIKFLIPFSMQIIWIASLTTPLLYLYKYDNVKITKKRIYLSIFVSGIIIWLFGFSLEVVADYQKKKFISLGLRKTKGFISSGVWSLSRHPNYMGEIILWLGISIMAFAKIAFLQPVYTRFIIFIAPIVSYILLKYFSGIPILEKNDIIKFGKIIEYLNYKKNTPILFFNPLKLLFFKK